MADLKNAIISALKYDQCLANGDADVVSCQMDKVQQARGL